MSFVKTIPYHPKFSGLPEILAEDVRQARGVMTVGFSADLQRILAVPQRALDLTSTRSAEKWTSVLRKRELSSECDCLSRYGERCICSLLAIQGHMLEEAATAGGGLDFVGIGSGKTGASILLPMVIPGIRRALLIIPSTMHSQFRNDYLRWSRHWHVPSLAGTELITPGYPVLHVIAYSSLQSPKASALLDTLAPDLIIADEAHKFANSSAVRTGRFKRYFVNHPSTRFVAMSGTLVKTAIANYSHLADFALRSKSPVPRAYSAVVEWDGALSPKSRQKAHPGALQNLANLCRVASDGTEGISVEEGFARRLESTPGVIVTTGEGLDIPIVVRKRELSMPPEVVELLKQVEKTWTRPDGADLLPSSRREDEMSAGLTVAMVTREIQSGFFHRWKWKNSETPEQISQWMQARKEWTRALRERLKRPSPHMDSPKLLRDACERWRLGFKVGSEIFPPQTRHPCTWNCPEWPEWREIKDTVTPESEVVWVSDFLAKDASEWVRENPRAGIVWYLNPAMGEKIAELSGAPLFGRGEVASAAIQQEKGDRTIVASILAHGTGKNLQRFHNSLIVQMPRGTDMLEQLLGRMHRTGQTAPEVSVDVYLYGSLRESFDSTLATAEVLREEYRQNHRILYARKELD